MHFSKFLTEYPPLKNLRDAPEGSTRYKRILRIPIFHKFFQVSKYYSLRYSDKMIVKIIYEAKTK